MQTIDLALSHARPRGALLAGAAFLAALALAAPSEAFAACGGTTASTGTHAPASGTGGTHSGSTPAAGSTGTGSCGVNATKSALSGGTVTPALTGVYAGAITGNGGKRKGSITSSTTANTVTTTSHTASAVKTTNLASGPVHTGGGGHFYHAPKRP